MSHGVRVCHHGGPCGGPGPQRRGVFSLEDQLLPHLLVSGLRGLGPAKTLQIIVGFGQTKLRFSSSVANTLLFLHSWTMDHAAKLAVFYDKRAVLRSASLFVFPKSTGCRTICFSFLQPCVGTSFIPERILTQIFRTKRFFLTVICFYAAKLKEFHVVRVFCFLIFFYNPFKIGRK